MMKQEIVDTVLSLINSNISITMEEVAKRSGVAKGTLYNYFANKEELFQCVHKTFIEPLCEEKMRIFQEDKDSMESIFDFVDYTFASFERVNKYFFFMQKYRTVEEDTEEKHELIIKPLAAALKKGIDKGQIININPIVLAEMIWGTIIGTFRSVRIDEPEKADIEKLKEDIVRLLKKLLIVE